MRIERVWAMPHRWTFTIPPIAQLIKEEMADSQPWVDPFAGMHSPAHVRNDLNPECNAEYHMDALDFLKLLDGQKFVGALMDPPFSPRQFRECYDMLKLKAPVEVFHAGYLADCMNQLELLVEVGGKVISCNWNSNGLGKNRGFRLDRVLLIAHGSGHNDTIVVVETKVQSTLDEVANSGGER